MLNQLPLVRHRWNEYYSGTTASRHTDQLGNIKINPYWATNRYDMILTQRISAIQESLLILLVSHLYWIKFRNLKLDWYISTSLWYIIRILMLVCELIAKFCRGTYDFLCHSLVMQKVAALIYPNLNLRISKFIKNNYKKFPFKCK